MSERLRVASGVLFLLVAASGTAQDGGYSLETLQGRHAFTTGQDGLFATVANHQFTVYSRGVLVFDGAGGVTGHRLSYSTAAAVRSEVEIPPAGIPGATEHVLEPIRQELAGTYTVSPEGHVEITVTADPVVFFAEHYVQQVGTTTVSATESVQATLSQGGARLEGFRVVSVRHVYPPASGAPDLDMRHLAPFASRCQDACGEGFTPPGQEHARDVRRR